MDLSPYDGNVEVHPVVEWIDALGDKICDVCEPEEATMWCVYLHLRKGGVDCIADCPDEDTALFVADAISTKLRGVLR